MSSRKTLESDSILLAKVTDTTQNNETKTSKKTSTNKVTTSKGETMWMQKLTGNTVEINGKMPEYVETWEQSTPAGKLIKLTVQLSGGI